MSFLKQLREIDFAELRRQISWRDVRNAIFGTTIVFGGLGLAAVTYLAYLFGKPEISGYAAMASLIFVGLILIFVVPPLARNASREFSQIDLPLELTSGGLILFGLLAIVGFAAWNTGNNLLFIVFAFLFSTLTVSILAAEFNLRNLEIKMRLPEIIFVGESLPISVSLENRKFILPAFSVLVGVRGRLEEPDFSQRPKPAFQPPKWAEKYVQKPLTTRNLAYFIYTSRRSTNNLEVNLLFPKRGLFIVKHLEITTKFPFGFWKRRHRLNTAETEVYIVPKPESVNDKLNLRSLKIGQMQSRRRGSGQDLWALREYQSSDESRHIDWKATARTRKLIVREFTAEDERRVTVVFDARMPKPSLPQKTPKSWFRGKKKNDAPKNETQERFERGVTLATSILAHFVTEKAEVRLLTDKNEAEFGAGKNFYQECLRRLAQIEPKFFDGEGEFSQTVSVLTQLEESFSNDETLIFITANQVEEDLTSKQNLQVLYF